MTAGLLRQGAAVYGHTYPVRDILRAAGGRWDGAARAWVYASEEAAAAAIHRADAEVGSGRARGAQTCSCGRAKRPQYSQCYSCSYGGGSRGRQQSDASILERGDFDCSDCRRLGRCCRRCEFDAE